MLERAKRMLPHAAILVCNMYIVFYLIDRVNTAMNFIDNGLTKGLLLILCIVGAYNAWTLIHAPAPRPARPAPQPRHVPARARTRYGGDHPVRQDARYEANYGYGDDARYESDSYYDRNDRYDRDSRYDGASRYGDSRYDAGRARDADPYGEDRYSGNARDAASSRRRHYDTEPRRRSEGYVARSEARDENYLGDAYGDDGDYR